MKVTLLTGSRANQTFDIPEKDAKKLIKKKMAKSLDKPKKTKKEDVKS
jgi:hypothetical protein